MSHSMTRNTQEIKNSGNFNDFSPNFDERNLKAPFSFISQEDKEMKLRDLDFFGQRCRWSFHGKRVTDR